MTKEQLPLPKSTEREFIYSLVGGVPVYLYNVMSYFAVDRDGGIYKYTTMEDDINVTPAAVKITNFALAAEYMYNGNYLLTASKDNIKKEIEASPEELRSMKWIYKLDVEFFYIYLVKELREYLVHRYDIKI